MRKIILGAGISLDGYVARPDGGIDFLGPVEGYTMSDLFASLDAIAFGRKTFDEALKRGGGSYDPPLPMPTYVFSRSNPPGERSGVIFTNQTPAAFVASMRQQNGKNIFVMGGGELARSFLQDDVVDELHLGVYPVLLGSGIPFFPPNFPQRNFTLAESKSYPPTVSSNSASSALANNSRPFLPSYWPTFRSALSSYLWSARRPAPIS